MRALTGIRDERLVRSFARMQSDYTDHVIRCVTFLRRVEMTEASTGWRPSRATELTVTVDGEGNPLSKEASQDADLAPAAEGGDIGAPTCAARQCVPLHRH